MERNNRRERPVPEQQGANDLNVLWRSEIERLIGMGDEEDAGEHAGEQKLVYSIVAPNQANDMLNNLFQLGSLLGNAYGQSNIPRRIGNDQASYRKTLAAMQDGLLHGEDERVIMLMQTFPKTNPGIISIYNEATFYTYLSVKRLIARSNVTGNKSARMDQERLLTSIMAYVTSNSTPDSNSTTASNSDTFMCLLMAVQLLVETPDIEQRDRSEIVQGYIQDKTFSTPNSKAWFEYIKFLSVCRSNQQNSQKDLTDFAWVQAKAMLAHDPHTEYFYMFAWEVAKTVKGMSSEIDTMMALWRKNFPSSKLAQMAELEYACLVHPVSSLAADTLRSALDKICKCFDKRIPNVQETIKRIVTRLENLESTEKKDGKTKSSSKDDILPRCQICMTDTAQCIVHNEESCGHIVYCMDCASHYDSMIRLRTRLPKNVLGDRPTVTCPLCRAQGVLFKVQY